jgi:hypothetical protein
MTLKMKRGDRQPSFVATVTDPDATFASVESWLLKFRASDASVYFEDDSPDDDTSVPNAVTLTHDWLAGETDFDGAGRLTLNVEATATWPDGTEQTFPVDGTWRVVINADLTEPV